MKTHDRVAGIFWLMVGVYTAVDGYRLGLGSLRHPGPGFIFFVSALALSILSLVNLAVTFVAKPKEDGDKESDSIWRGLRWQKILFVLLGAAAYAYFLNILGFLVSTFLLMVLLYKGVEPTRWWIAIVSSLITVLLSYTLFVMWLDVPFPPGFLGI